MDTHARMHDPKQCPENSIKSPGRHVHASLGLCAEQQEAGYLLTMCNSDWSEIIKKQPSQVNHEFLPTALCPGY